MVESILSKYYPVGVEKSDSYPNFYTSVEEEYEAIRQNVGVIDGGTFGLYRVSGEDSTTFLEQLATKEILYLNVGMTSECLMLNEEAKVIGFVFIQKVDEYYIVIVPPESKDAVNAWMHEKLSGDVVITDISNNTAFLFFEGRKAWKLFKQVADDDIESLILRGTREIEFEGESIRITRLSRTGEYGYTVMGNEVIVSKFLEKCFELKEQYGIKLCGKNAIEICMLEIRSINLEYETSDKGNIFELAQQWLVSFEKEEYIGVKALKELFSQEKNSLTVGFVCDKDYEVKSDDKVYLEDEVVGTVLYGFYSKGLEKYLGIAKLVSNLAVSGISLSLKNDQDVCEMNTISSPFFRPISWDEPME